jgi:hypothetical protein
VPTASAVSAAVLPAADTADADRRMDRDTILLIGAACHRASDWLASSDSPSHGVLVK